jgi:hypothetical protein
VAQLQARVGELEAKLGQSEPDELLDTTHAAAFLDMSPGAPRQAAWRGSIKSVRVGRRLRFKRSDPQPLIATLRRRQPLT